MADKSTKKGKGGAKAPPVPILKDPKEVLLSLCASLFEEEYCVQYAKMALEQIGITVPQRKDTGGYLAIDGAIVLKQMGVKCLDGSELGIDLEDYVQSLKPREEDLKAAPTKSKGKDLPI